MDLQLSKYRWVRAVCTRDLVGTYNPFFVTSRRVYKRVNMYTSSCSQNKFAYTMFFFIFKYINKLKTWSKGCIPIIYIRYWKSTRESRRGLKRRVGMPKILLASDVFRRRDVNGAGGQINPFMVWQPNYSRTSLSVYFLNRIYRSMTCFCFGRFHLKSFDGFRTQRTTSGSHVNVGCTCRGFCCWHLVWIARWFGCMVDPRKALDRWCPRLT